MGGGFGGMGGGMGGGFGGMGGGMGGGFGGMGGGMEVSKLRRPLFITGSWTFFFQVSKLNERHH